MDNTIKKLGKRVGKVDRAKQEEIRRLEKGRIYLSPRTGTEQTISELYNNFKNGISRQTREVEDGLNLYLNARNLRHDVWVDLLEFTCIIRRPMSFGDVNFGEFVDKMLTGYNRSPNSSLYNKTPDILLLSHGQYVLLGDVTVTKSVASSDRRKYFKYLDLETDLKSNGYHVKHVNLIIDEQLTNFRSELQKFTELELIQLDETAVKRATEYHKTCQIIMDNVPKQTVSQPEFWNRLDNIDRITVDIADIEIDEKILEENFFYDVNPTISENKLIEMIKGVTDKNLNFFDTNVETAIVSFDKLMKGKESESYKNPKSILKVCSNQVSLEADTNYELIKDYIYDISFAEDNEVKEFVLDLLPTKKQVNIMNKIYDDKMNNRAATPEDKADKVYGPYQYSRDKNQSHKLTNVLNVQLKKGKKDKNIKQEPDVIDPSVFNDSILDVENYIDYYGNLSLKKPFLDDSWDAKTNFEFDNTSANKETYDFCRKTNGAYLGHSLSNFYHRLMHLKTKLSIKDNIYVPPNGSFICVVPKEHAPVNSVRCDVPLIFLSRVSKDESEAIKQLYIKGIEYEYAIETDRFIYHISKLCRLSLDKIAHWNQMGYKIVATTSYLLSTCTELMPSKEKAIGIMTLLIADGHQKTSEYLDLLKYISFMPFSDLSRLSKLIEDKCDLMIKTKLDIWLLNKLRSFIVALSDKTLLNAIKPKLQLFNASVTRDSLGMVINLPSFINCDIRHKSIETFIEEVSMMFIIRPKQLYGSQFMDKSINNTVEWNIEYEDEVEKYKGWATDGLGEGNYPFDAKFCFSRDAIFYAQAYVNSFICPDSKKIAKSLNKSPLNTYMHYNCSLRGAVKNKASRKNINDLHTTSMDECLKYYKSKNYNDNDCTSLSMATEFIHSGDVMEFCMSEKEQRGGGRPIATPTLGAKACLMMIEKPEQAIGDHMPNNILVAGKHKLKTQSDKYKELLASGAMNGYKEVYQLTEDQSKFSENDNFRKYFYYISNNRLLPAKIRCMQLACVKKLLNREHLVKKIPTSMISNPRYYKFKNHNQNGFRAVIGWPQGMLNMISTSVHAIADYWITYAYNLAYPNNKVETSGLVHSDDSWVSVACNDIKDFERFTIFRTYAKRLFCLKLNDKKVWGSRYLGELVSNFNINGNVHLSVAKTLANSFSNLAYQNWAMDVHVQVSSIQQAYRNGANIGTLIMLGTILRQQMMDCYQASGYHKLNIYDLPVELGGYPDTSLFEIGVTGITSHYKKILDSVKMNPIEPVSQIILKALRLSIMHTIDKETLYTSVDDCIRGKTDLYNKFKHESTITDNDYQSIAVPSKGEVFSCIKHIMPKSKKVTETMNEIRLLPFSSLGMEMIVTRPKDLATALGNLKSQSSNMLYDLAAQKYTQSARRLAVSQAIQSSGKVVRVCDFAPMTINEMLYFIDRSPVPVMSPDMLQVALSDETDISVICESCVFRADYNAFNNDKRHIINRMPETEDKFKTVCKLKNVLLYIIDKHSKTNYLASYGSLGDPVSVLESDSELIRKRFHIYFQFYKVVYACNLIMQQYLMRLKSKLWMQPYLNNDSILSFLCDLYGKTVNPSINYKVGLLSQSVTSNRESVDLINSIYTVDVIDSIYDGKFKIDTIKGETLENIIKEIDYGKLDNDTYLKYAVLTKIHMGDNTHLTEYDTRKMYDQYYTKPQQYVNNKWTGDFEAVCRYGTTIVKIQGVPEDISISVNQVNISDILNCMNIFVRQNFKFYTYPHPNGWASSAFWQSKGKFSKLFLTSYNKMVTMVNARPGINSICLALDKYLRMPATYNNLTADDYILTEDYRIVNKVVNNATIKIASIPQSMSCPFASSIKLIPNLVDGYDNNLLLNTRVILNLTTKRYFNCSRSDLVKILKDRTPSLTGLCLINFYSNLINCFSELAIRVDSEAIDKCSEVETFAIHGIAPNVAIEEGIKTTPEDLTYIETDFIYEDEIRSRSIYIHTNFTRIISSILSNVYTKIDIDNIIRLLFANDKVSNLIMEDLDSGGDELNEKIEELVENDNLIELDIDILTFIIGNNLDNPDTFARIDLSKILSNRQVLINSKCYDMSQKLIIAILENISYEYADTESSLDKLKKRLA